MERTWKIKDWPTEDRPREKLVLKGAEALTDAEILALILGTGHRRAGANALDLARAILLRFNSLVELSATGIAELTNITGIGHAKAVQLKAALELARRLSAATLQPGASIKTSRDIYLEYRARLAHLRHELFIVVLLDARNRRIKDVTVAQGSLTEAVVHPREVFVHVIRESAAGILLVHNHPSGDPSPSMADLEITRRIHASATMLGVRLIDHIIVGSDCYTSFLDKGLLIHQEFMHA